MSAGLQSATTSSNGEAELTEMSAEVREPASGEASTADAVEVLLNAAPKGAGGDTAGALVEVYERMEQSYRAAAMAGAPPAEASSTTNFS